MEVAAGRATDRQCLKLQITVELTRIAKEHIQPRQWMRTATLISPVTPWQNPGVVAYALRGFLFGIGAAVGHAFTHRQCPP